MLDFMDRQSQRTGEAINRQLRTLYRARPYTKAVPFNRVLNAANSFQAPIWVPDSAYFEVQIIRIFGNVAATEITFSDTDSSAPINYVIVDNASYLDVSFGQGAYRSLRPNNSQLLAVSFSSVVVTVKGVCYGWEVTQEGYYR